MSDLNTAAIWQPSESVIRKARITQYTDWLRQTHGKTFDSYDALWQWSVNDLEGFWSSIVDYFGIAFTTPGITVLGDQRMPGTVWFPGTRLNYVDQIFRHATDARPAIIFRDESGGLEELGWHELQRQVASLAAALRTKGVGEGDRVVAYMPNIPETVVAFLAVASLGAIWSVCSPDIGALAVLDRFRQIEPKAMITVDGYRYGGKTFDRRDVVASILEQLPTVETLIEVPCLSYAVDNGAESRFPHVTHILRWADLIEDNVALKTNPVPFDHPLWIVYSSGTTGLPKPIVHGHGGVVLEQIKIMGLHNDLGPEDRYHWYSTTGWIMWNLQVAGLLVGTTVCIYDGNPGWPDLGALWRFAGDARLTFFGAGAAFYASCMKADIAPAALADLSSLRAIGSTGSPLSPEGYRWIYDHVNADVFLAPMSGGTDIASAFVGGIPTLPVFVGEMQCRCLGSRIEAFDDDGKPIVNAVGELVCTQPMPSMPLYFWNDPDGVRYRDSYYDMFPGIWRHGDWIQITPRGGAIIYGRSDATINRHGIRMGTSELYRAVEAFPEILDSLVVDLEYLGRESYMPLFVVLRPENILTDELKSQLVARIRNALSSRHVPNEIIQVDEIPHTLTGKKLELPVKKLLLGKALEGVVNLDAVANPKSLEYFVAFAQRFKGGPRVG